MNYILFDTPDRNKLLPVTYTRPVAEIRVGIMTIREKWQQWLNSPVSILTEHYLVKKFPLVASDDNILINASLFPTEQLISEIKALAKGEALVQEKLLLAARLAEKEVQYPLVHSGKISEFKAPIIQLKNNWEIFSLNPEAIHEDFAILTKNRKSVPLSKTNFVIGEPGLIFLEEGAHVEFAFLNTTNGPIYIGKDATVMEGSKIRGPFALGEHSIVKMDAKIYEGTTIGPHCKVGGEIQNVVFLGYSNKAHDGYLGNAVIGEWCNLGADTNNSNLKNTYDVVKLWSYAEERFVSTGLQFCGLIMGDHSKSGINTMFNTGTVIGVSCNLFGSGYQRNYLPSFTWGGTHGYSMFNLQKAFGVAKAVMMRRNLEFDSTEEEILKHIYDETVNKRAGH